MQMFVLDQSPAISARCLCDAHIRVIGREISMCLSSWYAQHMGHADELPYKAFNNPLVDSFDNEGARLWALANAAEIFDEFIVRFGKPHASLFKFVQIMKYRRVHIFQYRREHGIPIMQQPRDSRRFSFIEKGVGITPNLTMEEVIPLYRAYYKTKIHTMKVPVIWTETETRTGKPDWLEES